MKKSKGKQNFYEALQSLVRKEIKHLKRRQFIMKSKIFLLIILPVVIVMLTVKTAQVWLGIKLKEFQPASDEPAIKPVHQEIIRNEFITPEPVCSSTADSEEDT